MPNGAAGIFLLGQICEKQAKRKEAREYYQRALMMDPTLWCAFERLCKLQPAIDPSKFFLESHPYIQRLNEYIKNYLNTSNSYDKPFDKNLI